MCVKLDDTLKAYAAFLHRCKGFSDDGYNLVVTHHGESLWYHRYIHANGNVIELKLYPRELRIVQLTNGRENYSYTLLQP